ncbi:MAG: PD40 domain-containing protein [Chloroflexi bacterium]|nr:PD40 domain-containing protein [Chloroflexota bacterium]
MKTVYRTIYYFVYCALLVACNQTINASTPTLKPSPTQTPSSTMIPTVTATVTRAPYREPTLIPTIEPEKIPTLLNNLSIETLNTFNGHNLQHITGWDNGFNGGMWHRGSRNSQQGYKWLDSSHILLFPATGETTSPNWNTINVCPVVINIDSGKIWLPPIDRSLNEGRWFSLAIPRWSSELELLVTGETLDRKEGVSTFTPDGKRVTHYEGELIDISPSAERVFISGNTWIDLRSGKKVDFGWNTNGLGWDADGVGSNTKRFFPIWSRDETQIYFCCYYYGNAKTGESYTITNGDAIFDGGPFVDEYRRSLGHAYGVWLNDHIVMGRSDVWFFSDLGFIMIFDVVERTYHNLGVVANLPDAFNNSYSYKSISPNGDYMYVTPGAQSSIDPQVYLVNLKTFESQLYHVSDMSWMANGKYALLHTYHQLTNGEYSVETQVLTLSDKTLRAFPATSNLSRSDWLASDWHLNKDVHLSISIENQYLVVQALTFQPLINQRYEVLLSSDFNTSYQTYPRAVFMSPQNDRIALIAADDSIWIMDYPALENLEQVTPPQENAKDIFWSPDGRYLSYIDGTDIYIVDTIDTP